jgi:hypothetical protein
VKEKEKEKERGKEGILYGNRLPAAALKPRAGF